MYRDFDYYLRSGRVVQIPVERSPYERIRPNFQKGTYLATIRDTPGRPANIINQSAYATGELISQAILMRNGKWDEFNTAPSVTSQVPISLIDQLTSRIENAAITVMEQYESLGQEPPMVGAFFSRLKGTYAAEGWSLDVHYQSFSPIAKENHLGADVGVIFDIITSDGERLIKSVWFQAKRYSHRPPDLLAISDLRNQMLTMQSHTSSGHALIFTPNEVLSASLAETRSPLKVQDVFQEALECRRGDRSPEALANSFDIRTVVELVVSPKPKKARGRKV